jgi:hypothetical protein
MNAMTDEEAREYERALVVREEATDELHFWQLAYMAAIGHGEKKPEAWAAMACRDRAEKVKELGLDKHPPSLRLGRLARPR